MQCELAAWGLQASEVAGSNLCPDEEVCRLNNVHAMGLNSWTGTEGKLVFS